MTDGQGEEVTEVVEVTEGERGHNGQHGQGEERHGGDRGCG